MTGYAFIEKTSERFSFSLEIRSLNSKYIETYISLPKILRAEEIEMAAMLKKSFSRGRIELNIDILYTDDAETVSINKNAVLKYYKELSDIHSYLKLQEPLKLEAVLGFEGSVRRKRVGLPAELKKDIYAALSLAIKRASGMRKKEGQAVKADMAGSLLTISKAAAKIKKLAQTSLHEKQNSLRKRIEKLTNMPFDGERLFTEIALLADKLDINEELVRLNDHLLKYKSVMKDKGQIGKKLDFIAQEMFREINTIGSKSADSEISYLTVESKNHIDKLREHCRNIV